MAKLRILAIAAMIGGCASDPAVSGFTPAAGDLPQLAVNVAAQLQSAAANDPARLTVFELELRRISDALPPALVSRAEAAPGAIPAPLPEPAGMRPAPEPLSNPQPTVASATGMYPPPPELAGARSLFSALTLGAYPNADTARAAWFGMNTAHGEALAGLDARIETVAREDGATAFVLKAGPFASAQEAETLCARLRQAGAVCTAGDFTGERL